MSVKLPTCHFLCSCATFVVEMFILLYFFFIGNLFYLFLFYFFIIHFGKAINIDFLNLIMNTFNKIRKGKMALQKKMPLHITLRS